MSEQEKSQESQAEQAAVQGDSAAQEDSGAVDSVKRGGQIIFAVILLSLLWYLLSDRFTPYTTQARLDGYVVGVAPKVAGIVTEVWVSNNQEVEAGRRLFQIDTSQYDIALAAVDADRLAR